MYTTSGVYILENVIWEKEYEKGKRKKKEAAKKNKERGEKKELRGKKVNKCKQGRIKAHKP